MALSFVKHHDKKLEQNWHAKPAKDPLPGVKQKLSAQIREAVASLLGGKDKHKGWYNTKDGAEGVACQLRVKNKPLTVDGQDTWHVADGKRFYADVLTDLDKGELDNHIRQHLEGNAAPARATASRTRGQRSTAGKPLDPEKVYQRNVKRYGKERADELRARKAA